MPIALEIVSPDRLLLSQPVDMVVMPAAEGEMGVLPGHAPMIVLLQGGTITLHEGGRATSRLYVSGGFASYNRGKRSVVADFGTEEGRDNVRRLAAEAEAAYAAADRMDVAALDAAMARTQAARAMVAAAEAP